MKTAYLISKYDSLGLFPTKGSGHVSRRNNTALWTRSDGSYAWRCEPALLLTESRLKSPEAKRFLWKVYSEVSTMLDVSSGFRVFIHLGGLNPTAIGMHNQLLYELVERMSFSDVEFYCVSRTHKFPSGLFDLNGNYTPPSSVDVASLIQELRMDINENRYEHARALKLLRQIGDVPIEDQFESYYLQMRLKESLSDEEKSYMTKESKE